MSVDLDWSLLTPSLASAFLRRLNSSIQAVDSLPEYLGGLEVTEFDFGDVPADVTLVDIGDVSREIVEAAERDDAERRARENTDGASLTGSFGGWAPTASLDDAASERGARQRSPSFIRSPDLDGGAPEGSTAPKPSLQLHLHVYYSGNLRLSLNAALLVNYPSPLFMSLPLKLSVVSVVFNAEVVLAVEADRGRAHVCVVEPPPLSSSASVESSPKLERKRRGSYVGGEKNQSVGSATAGPGKNIIPEMVVETEVGNVDKHVLRNVGKVERFVADLVRKLVCDELLFPNFHTISWAG